MEAPSRCGQKTRFAGGITGTGEKKMLIRKIIIRVIIVAVAFSSRPDV